MTPDPVIRLASVVHTLEQVIVPAVDPGNSLAVEQCGLVLAQLRMLVEHLPYIGAYHALCLGDLVATVDGLPAAAGGPACCAAAIALAGQRAAIAGETRPESAFHALGRAFEALVLAGARDGEPAYRAQVETAVLGFSERQSWRARTWFRDAGFDAEPEALPELADLFSGQISGQTRAETGR